MERRTVRYADKRSKHSEESMKAINDTPGVPHMTDSTPYKEKFLHQSSFLLRLPDGTPVCKKEDCKRWLDLVKGYCEEHNGIHARG